MNPGPAHPQSFSGILIVFTACNENFAHTHHNLKKWENLSRKLIDSCFSLATLLHFQEFYIQHKVERMVVTVVHELQFSSSFYLFIFFF